ncbi:helix-turn-helix transcriptional regulator [Nonomuraea sp. NPDC001684]
MCTLAPVDDHPVRAVDQFLDVLVTRATREYVQGLPSVRRALATFRREGFRRENIAWCRPACQLAMDVWDDEACAAMAGGLAEAAREGGLLTVLPFALNYSAAHQLFAGRFDLAQQLIREADSITQATSNVAIADFSILLAAWRGDRERTLDMRDQIIAEATDRGEGFVVEAAGWAAATLHLGHGEYGAAAEAAHRAAEPDGIGFTVWVLPELIEAAIRALDAMGAAAFAQRAEQELLATGETVHKRSQGPSVGLTSQEAQIARLAGGGHTDPEIAARLFVSHRTVEWHLSKAFTKLDVTSRKDLAQALRAAEPATV